jgi:hypothetical protein
MLKIEKFVGEDHERTLKAPDLLVKLANRVLPASAQAELRKASTCARSRPPPGRARRSRPRWRCAKAASTRPS